MRSYFLTTLAVAGLAAAAHGGARKSLGFGPVLPHAGLRTLDVRGFTADGAADPFAVAEALVRELTAYEFVRREDSYTDAATGVSHVYFRQRVNGVEVADGDINVNVRDGLVLSYGNSVRMVCVVVLNGR
jgi:extracellular elastinolytic metalloproteinase